MQNKKAISLIVLVITVIVVIILSGAVLVTLSNAGIIKQSENAVKEYDLDEVQTLVGLKWSEAYMEIEGKKTVEKLEQAVMEKLEKEKIDWSKYDITIKVDGVEVSLYTNGVPAKWEANITAIVDTVPIPKGFVASSVDGENRKNSGLVIYEGTESVTYENHYDALRTRNQYVWVPVEDFEWQFVRQNFGRPGTISNTLGTDYWEVELDKTTNMPLTTQSTSYMTSTTLAEVQAMYESVKEYKGFYIARYEAGIDSRRTAQGNAADLPGIKEGTTVYSVMGKIPYTIIPWTWNNSMNEDTNGAVEVARRIYPATNTNYGVVSTLTYGVQWDRTLAWWVETKAQNATKTVTIASNDNLNNSTNYGNYRDHVIAAGDLNDGAEYAVVSGSTGSFDSYQAATSGSTKASGREWALTTGALKAASVNNICDMAGNMAEWTMEGNSTGYRIIRGGYFHGVGGSYSPVSNRSCASLNLVGSSGGFRPSLYIKK